MGFDKLKVFFVISLSIMAKPTSNITPNTLLYNLAFIVFGVIFEVGFAIMLSEITKKTFKKVSQAFMFLPYFISWVVVSTVMLNIFGQNGVLSNILTRFGIEDFSIYQQVKQWPVVMVGIRLWKQTGYGTVVYLAAIAGLSQEMFEAASIDGANIWQKIRYITWRLRYVLPACEITNCCWKHQMLLIRLFTVL